MKPGQATLRLVEVTKRFNGRTVLDRISLQIGAGEAVVIMGPSGGGKSVLLKHLIGLLRPDEGRLEVDGEDFWSKNESERAALRRRCGVAFQEGALFDSMTVFDNIAFPLRRNRRLSRREVRERVTQCLARVRLTGIEQRLSSELSTGMRRRVGFARAIALEPRVLLFDEPTAGLDPVMVTVMNQLMRELKDWLRATTVMVTHDLRTARAVAQRFMLLSRGRVVADAPAEEFERLELPEVRQFMTGSIVGRSTPRTRWEPGRDRRGKDRRPGARGHRHRRLLHRADENLSVGGQDGKNYLVTLPNAQGLADKAPVLLRGVRVGRVNGLALEGEQVVARPVDRRRLPAA